MRSKMLVAVVVALGVAGVAAAEPTVSNVRAAQLGDGTKRVEVLYDLSGAPPGGATVSVRFSSDGGASYAVLPAAGTLSGHVGAGVVDGPSRRLVWDAPATLPAGFWSTMMRAAVTAVDPGGSSQEMIVYLPGDVPLEMVWIPPGSFLMGSPLDERGRSTNEDLHSVTLTQGYWMGRYLVTQLQWEAVMGTPMPTSCGSTYGMGWQYPVYCVSWNDIAAAGGFVERLNTYLGTTTFRLPTEAEWERAARAGTQTRFSHGDVLECGDLCEECATHGQYMWWCGNAGVTSHPIGTKLPNGFGLYDMHGHLFEWVQDWHVVALGTAPVIDPAGPGTGTNRSVRSGRYGGQAKDCRSAVRFGSAPSLRHQSWGFRLAKSE